MKKSNFLYLYKIYERSYFFQSFLIKTNIFIQKYIYYLSNIYHVTIMAKIKNFFTLLNKF